MASSNGRVTIFPKQIRRLAELSNTRDCNCAIEVIQTGSVLYFNNGSTKLYVDANGNDVHPHNQEKLC